MNDIEVFKQSIQTGGFNCFSIITYEEDYALDIVKQSAIDLKRNVWVWSVTKGLREGFWVGTMAEPNTNKPLEALSKLSEIDDGAICVTLDLAEHLKDNVVLRILKELIEQFEKTNKILVIIDGEDKLPEAIKLCCKPFELSYPDYEELREVISRALSKINREKPVELGVSKKGLDTIIRNLKGLSRKQVERIILDTVSIDHKFWDEDINDIIIKKRQLIERGGLLEFVQTPVDLSEIGGMSILKKWFKTREMAFDSKAEQFGISQPKGILMLGVQGAGKSMCAKAAATAWKQPLFRLDPSVLYASYVGESEQNLRNALKQVEVMAPVILWIDEIEKGFASAASRSIDGGLSQRMFGTFLTWMQEKKTAVFVIATANDISALPPELLRKGRFDEIFFVDLPRNGTRKQIFEIHLTKRKRDIKKFDLVKLANASEGFSGAEIEQAIISALHEAYSANKDLDDELLLKILKNSPPLSVTMAECVIQLREWAKGRCVPVD